MSKYRIDSDRYLINVGYDQPLRTFFATIEDPSLPDKDCLLLWVGNSYDEITTLNQLYVVTCNYFTMPDDIILKLDRDSQQPFQPTPLQIQTENLFNHNQTN